MKKKCKKHQFWPNVLILRFKKRESKTGLGFKIGQPQQKFQNICLGYWQRSKLDYSNQMVISHPVKCASGTWNSQNWQGGKNIGALVKLLRLPRQGLSSNLRHCSWIALSNFNSETRFWILTCASWIVCDFWGSSPVPSGASTAFPWIFFLWFLLIKLRTTWLWDRSCNLSIAVDIFLWWWQMRALSKAQNHPPTSMQMVGR